MTAAPPSEAVVWHDVECGAYDADLPLWRELAAAAAGPVLDVGAGTGRVTLDLAARGHAVTALDRDAALLAALRERAGEAAVDTAVADARDFDLGRRFALVLAPMQLVQLLDEAGRRAFLERARAHLAPRGVVAAALAADLERFDAEAGDPLPLPDVREVEGWVYASQPVALRVERGMATIERLRQRVSPSGEREESRDVVRLHALAPERLVVEAAAAGLRPLPTRGIAATADHVGSITVLLRAGD